MSIVRTDQVSPSDAGSATGAMDLHIWQPEQPPRAALLLIQEIFGVGPYIRAVAERLANAGYLVGAPDVFWRFHPNWQSDHSKEGLQASAAERQKLDFPLAVSDCIAGLHHLGAQAGLDAAPGVIGFCLGGTLAWSVAAHAEPSVCVSYYGSGVPEMLDLIDAIHCPTLLHFGNADGYISTASIDAVAAVLPGHPGFVLNVENAGHAFDNHESEMFYEEAAAQAAWTKTMAFLGDHLPAT